MINWEVVEEEVNKTVNPLRAVAIAGSNPRANKNGPKIIPPPIPKAPAAIPVK